MARLAQFEAPQPENFLTPREMRACIKKAAEWLAAKSREAADAAREARPALAGKRRSGRLIQHCSEDNLMTEQCRKRGIRWLRSPISKQRSAAIQKPDLPRSPNGSAFSGGQEALSPVQKGVGCCIVRSVECGWDGMERYKKGAELAAWHHGYQAGEFAVARLCPYSTGSALAKACTKVTKRHARNRAPRHPQKLRGTNDHGERVAIYVRVSTNDQNCENE